MLRAVQLNAAGHDMKEEMVSDSAPDEGPSLEEQLCLLTDSNSSTNEDEAEYVSDFIDAKNAVLFPPSVLATSLNAPPQYSLLGRNISSIVGTNDPRVLINTNQPWSVFICGLQGSGKSYSMGCLLGTEPTVSSMNIPNTHDIESCLIPNRILGPLQRPLTGLVLHYGQYTSSTSFYPSEAAFLAVPNPDFSSMQSKVNVTVYVSPSNYHGLSATYSQIPGVTVRKLLLQPHQLDISSMLNLMAIDQKENTTLYMAQVTKVLRDMAMETGGFDFFDFKSRIKGLNLFSAQRKALDQRIGLLESFLDVDTQSRGSLFDFTPGALNIVDLSCPFVDSGMACILFDICLSTFLQTQTANCKGKVIALDEAHKVSIPYPDL